jgi:peptide/nickel transport system substrate-binding protein
MTTDQMHYMLNRRRLLATGGAVGVTALAGRAGAQGTPASSPDVELMDELVIDLSGPPDHLTPALTYSVRDWSILHSVYDSLVDFGPDGELVPLAAEEFSSDDAMTFRVRLREGMTFHDGTPVTTAAITRSVEHIQAADSQISELYDVITEVREIDELNAEIIASEPSAWLPSQIAVWGVLIPESATDESLASQPIGSGPYIFESYDPGSAISLRRNPEYFQGGPKGVALAERVVFRFVPEATTRVADLSTGAAHIVAEIPTDQIVAIQQAGHTALSEPILGTAFVRIATGVAPFDDSRVCQAINHAVDVQTIADALVGEGAHRLAGIFPDPRGLGFDGSLQPFSFDPDRARTLLADAGLADGFDTEIEIVAGSRSDVVESIVAYLADVGVRLSIVTSELAAFNQGWPDDTAPPLRYATWRPFYDPQSFLRLVIDSDGFLSRYENPAADELVRAGATAPTYEEREGIYHDLGREMQEHPAAIYLWNLVSTYGVNRDLTGWRPRGDEYVIPVRAQATGE